VKLRHLFRTPWVQKILTWLIFGYLKFVYHTSRWKVEGLQQADQIFQSGKPLIVCVWHGRMAMIPCMWHWPHISITSLVSLHTDGQFVGQALKHFGIPSTFGSTNRGGTRALKEMINRLKNNEIVFLTPDGPRGPRQVVSQGVITMAKLAKSSIMVVTFSTHRYIELKTWDRFHLPLPFSRGALIYGPVLTCPEDDNWELYRQNVEQELTNLQNYADHICGKY
jgi:lysophospholipid acyltransferase (LPLAT)-like uncharacterized protein